MKSIKGSTYFEEINALKCNPVLWKYYLTQTKFPTESAILENKGFISQVRFITTYVPSYQHFIWLMDRNLKKNDEIQ